MKEKFDYEAVREYLREFTKQFYAPLSEKLKTECLIALQGYFENLYKIEHVQIETSLESDELILKIESCPAIMHMRAHNMAVAPLFFETTKTVNETICEGSDFAFELIDYDEQTGQSLQRFYRRQS